MDRAKVFKHSVRTVLCLGGQSQGYHGAWEIGNTAVKLLKLQTDVHVCLFQGNKSECEPKKLVKNKHRRWKTIKCFWITITFRLFYAPTTVKTRMECWKFLLATWTRPKHLEGLPMSLDMKHSICFVASLHDEYCYNKIPSLAGMLKCSFHEEVRTLPIEFPNILIVLWDPHWKKSWVRQQHSGSTKYIWNIVEEILNSTRDIIVSTLLCKRTYSCRLLMCFLFSRISVERVILLV